MPSIAGQFILVIGGSSGIGLGVAKLALADGVQVAIASSNQTRVASAVEGLQSRFPDGKIAGYQVDLSGEDAEVRLETLLAEVTAGAANRLDHIVYTAGDQLALKTIHEVDLDFIRKAGHLRFVVPLLSAKLANRFLKPSTRSSLILTTGSISQKPLQHWSVIASYATGLHGMTRNLALDLQPIRVNLVSPGPVATPLWGDGVEAQEAAAKHSLTGTIATPEEVAEAYIYLMKDTSTTGICVSTSSGGLLK
jgi:NAD(P)-dependent dehydrogenase (short-subunit alcohol dehydrogenase family)